MSVDWNAMRNSETVKEAEFLYVFDFQYRHGGGFSTTLYEAIHAADINNRTRLARGFPDEVAAVNAWTSGDLAKRVKEFGVD